MIATSELVTWLRAPESRADEIARLERSAVAAAEKRGGFYYGPRAELVQMVSWSAGPIQLRAAPIGEVSVERWSGAGWEVVGTTGFYVQDALLYLLNPPYSRTSVQYRLTYEGGYEVDENDANVWAAPDDVKHAVRTLVALWFNNPEGNVEGSTAPAVDIAFGGLIEARATI